MRWIWIFSVAVAAVSLGLLAACKHETVHGPGAGNPAVTGCVPLEIDAGTGFAVNAFPPTLTDQTYHQDAWMTNDCLRCHETGVGEAPMVRHRGLPAIALAAQCRSCHVASPGDTRPRPRREKPSPYAANAFPPLMPNTPDHKGAWGENDCLMCHKKGISGAGKVVHKGMPEILLKARCRTCHVQVRSHQTSPWDR